jgi:hypothetical protein
VAARGAEHWVQDSCGSSNLGMCVTVSLGCGQTSGGRQVKWKGNNNDWYKMAISHVGRSH